MLHFVLYSYLLATKVAYECLEYWLNYFKFYILWLVHRSDTQILRRSNVLQQLRAQEKKLEHVSLIYNQVGGDVEVLEIRRVAILVHWLSLLGCQHISIYDKEGILLLLGSIISEQFKRELHR